MKLTVPEKATLSSFVETIEAEEGLHRGEIYPGVLRGTGYTLSSQTEDLFAAYLKEILGDRAYAILVDVSMMIGKTHCRPDIVVVERQKGDRAVIGLLDIKTSLGWVRDKVPHMAEKYRGLRDDIDRNGGKVLINGVGNCADGTCLDGRYPVREDAAWDVFVRDVWGSGGGVPVLDQIKGWNSDEGLSQRTRIFWGRCWFSKKENMPGEVNESVFYDIARRISGAS